MLKCIPIAAAANFVGTNPEDMLSCDGQDNLVTNQLTQQAILFYSHIYSLSVEEEQLII